MRRLILAALLAFPGTTGAPREPLSAAPEDSALYRLLQKEVIDSRLLDDMENAATWRHQGNGAMSFTRERRQDGVQSLRLRSPTKADKPGPQVGRPFGDASVIKLFAAEDWSQYNRLSLWVYPDLPGFPFASLRIRILTDHKPADVPEAREFLHHALLQNQSWNHLIWEIGNVPRRDVTGIEISYRLQGNEPHAAGEVTFDLDRLELQKVEQEHTEGWNVAPNRIAFSHTGYQTGALKSAVASNLAATEFEIVRLPAGEVVLTKPVRQVETPLGRYQLMEFSELRKAGTYFLRAGDLLTRSFQVDDDVWYSTIWKAINFFYVERCGFAVPGIHDVCHRDWQAVHGGKRIVINGGWHDAGDLSQGIVRTSQAAYAMFDLADRLRTQGRHPELVARLVEEAKWGLDWVLRTSFGAGYRVRWSVMDFWTNGVMGDVDDVAAEAENRPRENFMAAATEAIAARLLKDSDADLARYCLRKAREDWHAAMESPGPGNLEQWASGALASFQLYRATGEQAFAGQAFDLARRIVGAQQRTVPAQWKEPLAGYFRDGRDGFDRGWGQTPLLVLGELCTAFPHHPDWIHWYSTIALHSEYLRRTSQFTEPYAVLPYSIYHDEEYRKAPESERERLRRQVLEGIPIGPNHYLRRFEAWGYHRGHFIHVLPQAQALAVAAHVRGDPSLAELAERQLQWIVGLNPFVQSVMYGEGYDWEPQFSAMSGNIVGSLPVGFQTRGYGDVPYWPFAVAPNYKEVFVLPVLRWIHLMRDVAGPALITGRIEPGGGAVEARSTATGEVIRIEPDFARGEFRAWLPGGHYSIRHGGRSRSLAVVPAGSYSVDLRPQAVEFTVGQTTTHGRETVRITVRAQGAGRHRFALRCDNLPALVEKEVDLSGEARTLVWEARIEDPAAPWVAVVVPDGDPSQRKEILSWPAR